MAIIEGIKIENYRVLRHVTLGKMWYTPDDATLTPMTAVIGKNGVGKSSLFDAFGFLSDCLKLGVEEACDQRGRGGFDRIRSQGITAPIEFEVCYRKEPDAQLITYLLSINKDASGRPSVFVEALYQHPNIPSDGEIRAFLMLFGGSGTVWKGDSQGQQIDGSEAEGIEVSRLFKRLEQKGQVADESADMESVQLQDNRRLGIATLGALKEHPRISAFRQFIEGWYLSYFTPDAARSLPMAGPQREAEQPG